MIPVDCPLQKIKVVCSASVIALFLTSCSTLISQRQDNVPEPDVSPEPTELSTKNLRRLRRAHPQLRDANFNPIVEESPNLETNALSTKSGNRKQKENVGTDTISGGLVSSSKSGSGNVSATAVPAAVPSNPPGTPKETAPEVGVIKVETEQAKPPHYKIPSDFEVPDRRADRMPFRPGERMIYDVTYFGVPAGTFTMSVLPDKFVAGRKAIHLHLLAESSKVFSMFYKVMDQMESFLDAEGLFSLRFHLRLDESKQLRQSIEVFDHPGRIGFYWDKRDRFAKGKSEARDFNPIEPFGQDGFSALYYLRLQNFQVGQTISYPVISEGKTWEAVGHVERKERMEAPYGWVNTYVVRPETKFRGVLQQNAENSYVWISDDERKVLVRIEARVKLGSVIAQLKQYVPGQ